MVTAPPMSTPARRPTPGAAGSSGRARTIASTPIGTLSRKMRCQSPVWVSTPPRTTPTAPPADATKPQTLIALARTDCSWNRSRISDSATACTIAPPTPCTAQPPSSSGAGPLDGGNVDLLHRQHRVERALRLGRIRIAQGLDEAGWDDLPPEAEPVLHPSALRLLATGGELLPELVDLRLVRAVDVERDRLGELELRTGVPPADPLALDLERHARRLAVRTRGDAQLFRAVEDRQVVAHRLFGLIV